MPSVGIAKLSPTQIRKMKQGKPFRITAGTSTTIGLNDLQYKGFIKNAKNGKSYTIVFHSKEGSGIVGDLAGLLHPAAGVIAKTLGLGMKKTKGKGILGDLGKYALNFAKDKAIETAIDYGSSKGKDFLKNTIGFGMLRNASPKQLEALARARAMRKPRIPKKPKKNGPKRPATLKQLENLAKARAMRGMKKSGSGRGRKKTYGSALRVAGM
jgi:hypothetical protein